VTASATYPALADIVFRDLAVDGETFRACSETLSITERRRANRYRFPADRRRFIVGRGLLRSELAGRIGAAPHGVPIVEGLMGKPMLADAPQPWFSASRCGDLAAFAFAPSPVGIDLVRVSDAGFLPAMAREICSPREVAALDRLAPGGRASILPVLWARKEALLKATGEGLVRLPDWVEVGDGRDSAEARVTQRGRVWSITDVPAPVGHIAAVAQACD
jgi:4'-phosphopantetheinyl transferase